MILHKLIKTKCIRFGLDELAEFLVVAKKSCYAGNGQEQRMADGSKQLTFQQGNFHYTDNYSGYYQAPGTEIVRWKKSKGQRIWQMSYSGGVLTGFMGNEGSTECAFEFLKRALSNVSEDAPFRGPKHFEDVGFVYSNKVNGDVTRFSGHEKIFSKFWEHYVFEQDYMGGLVIPK